MPAFLLLIEVFVVLVLLLLLLPLLSFAFGLRQQKETAMTTFLMGGKDLHLGSFEGGREGRRGKGREGVCDT